MNPTSYFGRVAMAAALAATAFGFAATAEAQNVAYNPIAPTMENQTITLDGHNMTIDQLVAIARYGAKVAITDEAKQREADQYGLLLQAAAEGIPVYWFNRGAGQNREVVMFEGDPLSASNKALLEKRQLAGYQRGPRQANGPELSDEEIVRAIMAARVNAMTYDAPSPQLAQMLIDLLNKRVTPVVGSRGTVGEGDLEQFMNIAGTMVGSGDAYYRGVRMPASEALKKAGLKPLQPFAADDNALTSSNAYATAQAALMVYDAKAALGWADLIYAIDLNGMNSSITPLSLVVQAKRPFPWLNWHAARMLEMIKGSYLFDADPKRIIQDPESLRASSIRQGSAWEAWGELRDTVVLQLNSSDHNPAAMVGMSPDESWELATPQLMKYRVKGGPASHGKGGYIVSNANWDPYPLSNKVEAFTIALGNMDGAVMQRLVRFTNIFFTVVAPADVLPPEQLALSAPIPPGNAKTATDIWQEIQTLMNPVTPEGNAIVATVEDLQAQSRLKTTRGRQAVDLTLRLLAEDLMTGAYWMDVRKAQDPKRQFGPGATAAWTAFRKAFPFAAEDSQRPNRPFTLVAYDFLRTTPPDRVFPTQAAMPTAATVPAKAR